MLCPHSPSLWPSLFLPSWYSHMSNGITTASGEVSRRRGWQGEKGSVWEGDVGGQGGTEEEGGTNGKAGSFCFFFSKKRATSKEQEMTNVGYGSGSKHKAFLADNHVNFWQIQVCTDSPGLIQGHREKRSIFIIGALDEETALCLFWQITMEMSWAIQEQKALFCRAEKDREVTRGRRWVSEHACSAGVKNKQKKLNKCAGSSGGWKDGVMWELAGRHRECLLY